MNRVIYSGVFLDAASRERLFAWWRECIQIPLLDKLYGHHLTIQFRPTNENLLWTPIGEFAHLRIIGWASDDFAQAVLVAADIPSANPLPHVTVATHPDTKPVYSNELVKIRVTPVLGPVLTGTIDTYPPQGADHMAPEQMRGADDPARRMTRNSELMCEDIFGCDHSPETPITDGGEIIEWRCRCGQVAKVTPLPAIQQCGQSGCSARAVARFIWPGSKEAGICADHLPKLRAVAKAIRLDLEIIPLSGP